MDFNGQQNLILLSEENLQALVESSIQRALQKFISLQEHQVNKTEYLSISEVVRLFKLTRPTLNKLVKSNSIRSYRPGGVRRILFIESELKEDLKNYQQRLPHP
ncbi:helix-turn-helix domain-containing protein [Pontibacter akesuensis]|uniref:helix-turn-helix domain-containing protein n=1 Tax=Pontibacter akesuensis TaxID=388950 RepID=UPI000839F047|nr:helix-turn-helix domain-containing protein [Pontibacter akesuensis]GHA76867.1 hypothetical protein GCM10007389_33590 [Pontibacter akesuensis]